MTVRVRLFAGAAEAVGQTELRSASASVGDLLGEITSAGGPGAADVLGRCSILVNGSRAGSEEALPPGALVDVLPPFAGG